MGAERGLVVRKNIAKQRLLMVFPVMVAFAVQLLGAETAFAAEGQVQLVSANTKFSTADQRLIVSKHNQYRDEVGVGHLSWDNGLASDAQSWADKLASRDDKNLDHSDAINHHEGENLAWTSGAGSPITALNMWYAEKAAYQAEPNKTHYLGNPNFRKWGHYSQMVWSATTHVGCGVATGASGTTYTSCRYRPPGNVEGELAYSPYSPHRHQEYCPACKSLTG
jgi:uncharacterized protein YkwD